MEHLNEFHIISGQTIMACQRVEHDVKLIYAGMLSGDFDENLTTIKAQTLGAILKELQNLDNSDGDPYFTKKDYTLLKEILTVRNWLVHRSYMDFMYEKGEDFEQKLNASYRKLVDFNRKIMILSDQVENVRIDILKRFGRV